MSPNLRFEFLIRFKHAHTKANIADSEGSVAGHNLEGSLEASSTVPFGSR